MFQCFGSTNKEFLRLVEIQRNENIFPISRMFKSYSMVIPTKKRFYRLIVTLDDHEYLASQSFDMSRTGRWGGFPVAHIYSGITSSMRREHNYASAVTITNVLQWQKENELLEVSDHAEEMLEERGLSSISNCVFPPSTLIVVNYSFKAKEFRFHQLVNSEDKYFFFVFTLEKGGHCYPHSKFPSLLLKTDLERSKVRLVTVIPATKRYFESMKDVVQQEPSGTECIVLYEDFFRIVEHLRTDSE